MQGFIFGGNTGMDYETLQRRRKIAESMMSQGAPRTIGEGISSAAGDIAAALMGKKLDKREGEMRDQFNSTFTNVIGGTSSGAPASGGMSAYRDAIASIESDGSGGYSAVGPTSAKLGRALGRYQIMEANIGPWSREALGREVSADEFLASPQIQDAIFDHKFGGYVQKFGPEGAAQAWFAGPGGVGKMGRQDVLGTSVADYTKKFRGALGGSPQASQGNIAQIAALASNPMASPAQKAIAETLLQRQMQQGDPMYQLQLQNMQSQIDARSAPQPQFRQVTGAELGLSGPQAEMLFNVAPDGKISQIGGGGTSVTVNNQGNTVEPLGTDGQILVPDPNSPSGYRVEVAEGSKEAYRRQQDQAEAQDLAEKAELAQDAKETSANIVLDEISIARDLIGDESLFSPATGITGKVMSVIDSTRAGALKNRLTTIKANIGFDKLQAMRDASPTGGALGQVSEFENRLLQAVFGSLEQAQERGELIYNLERLETIYNRVINEGIPDDEARELYRQIATGEVPQPEQAGPTEMPTPPDGYTQDEWKTIWDAMPPEDRKLFQ